MTQAKPLVALVLLAAASCVATQHIDDRRPAQNDDDDDGAVVLDLTGLTADDQQRAATLGFELECGAGRAVGTVIPPMRPLRLRFDAKDLGGHDDAGSQDQAGSSRSCQLLVYDVDGGLLYASTRAVLAANQSSLTVYPQKSDTTSTSRPPTTATPATQATPAPTSSACAGGVPDSSRQLVISIVDDWNATQATVRLYQRDAGQVWRVQAVGPFAAVIGKNGLAWGVGLHGTAEALGGATKQEGDQRAPAGIFALPAAFGYASPAEPGGGPLHLPYHQVDAHSRCVDDPDSLHYNHILYDEQLVTHDWRSAESLRRSDELYRQAIIVDHNHVDATPVTSGGSCIFLHIWRGSQSTTAGCTALAAGDLRQLLGALDANLQPLLVQLPRQAYTSLQDAWCLPPL